MQTARSGSSGLGSRVDSRIDGAVAIMAETGMRAGTNNVTNRVRAGWWQPGSGYNGTNRGGAGSPH